MRKKTVKIKEWSIDHNDMYNKRKKGKFHWRTQAKKEYHFTSDDLGVTYPQSKLEDEDCFYREIGVSKQYRQINLREDEYDKCY